jgi:hypothetical protein
VIASAQGSPPLAAAAFTSVDRAGMSTSTAPAC